MKPSLLSIVRCPECHGDFSLETSTKSEGEIESGKLQCNTCRQHYPIVRFIPRFVGSDQYVKSFSTEWRTFVETQLDQEMETATAETFHVKTGRVAEQFNEALVLEAGCGMGRFLDVVSRNTRTTVVGFDLSLAVESAYLNVGARRNVHIVQADIMKPPFAPKIFDFVYSIGVLHHTPNPRMAFRSLVPLLKEDREIAIWVYSHYKRPPMSDLYRVATTRMPHGVILAVSRLLASVFPLTRKFRYLLVLLPMSIEDSYERRVLDNFDWYSPKYQFKFDTRDVVAWFKEMNFRDITILTVPISVRGKLRKASKLKD